MQEIWKDVIGYESLYQVSNLGRVKRLHSVVTRSDRLVVTIQEKILKVRPNHKGYLLVEVCKDGVRKGFSVHKLVALSFIPNPDNLPAVNHLDSDRTNNKVNNLEWCSYKQNTEHAIKHGDFIPLNGSEGYSKDHPKLISAKELIDQGFSMREVSRRLGITKETLKKYGLVSLHGSVKRSY